MADSDETIEKAFSKMALSSAERHVFLCVGPDCCSSADGLATWEFLKRRLRELDLPVLRSKAACLRICSGGPWLLVYPEGVWYSGVTPERCERIVQQHLVGGRVVQEWVSARHPLPGASGSSTS